MSVNDTGFLFACNFGNNLVQNRKKLFLKDRLQEVVVGSHGVAFDCEFLGGGEKDYFDFFVEFPYFMSRLHSCEAGHDDIEDKDVVICFFKSVQKFHSIGICMNRYRCDAGAFVFK